MSDARKIRYKQQQRILFKMKNPNRAGIAHANRNLRKSFGHRGPLHQDIIDEDDENLHGSPHYIPQSRYISRSLFDSLFSSDPTNETEEEVFSRKRLWALWLPLLETSFEAQEQYLKNIGVNKPIRRKGLWRRAKIPKEFKQLLKRQPDPMFIAQFENELLEYIQSYDTKLKTAFTNTSVNTTILPPEILPFIFHDDDPFHRLLAHSVAQYYGFTSSSRRDNDGNVTIELNGIWRVLQHLPDLTLSEYLVKMENDKDKMYLHRHFKGQPIDSDQRMEQKRLAEVQRIRNRMRELTKVQVEVVSRNGTEKSAARVEEVDGEIVEADNAFALLIDEEGNREDATARLTSLRSDFARGGGQSRMKSHRRRQRRP
ncbi:hypothetical protein BLNAU_15402 [Blattamonas nauphoetae]|uniref:R3H domain-containing protein n=1 Tax=Blattamonas nauphoetae TaxID=2049346 RepID=A0ABQ9XCJ1_9EUKA|nr:hypothetical protein BLNAU_15402 [Blattamonas nauphoetae]